MCGSSWSKLSSLSLERQRNGVSQRAVCQGGGERCSALKQLWGLGIVSSDQHSTYRVGSRLTTRRELEAPMTGRRGGSRPSRRVDKGLDMTRNIGVW
jgi:hypothetical protein